MTHENEIFTIDYPRQLMRKYLRDLKRSDKVVKIGRKARNTRHRHLNPRRWRELKRIYFGTS